jgi:tripartite-type tricarboxylate transporter receptor subunit TctC
MEVWGKRALGACLLSALMTVPAYAEDVGKDVESAFRGKQATMIIYAPAGGTYDIYARLLIRFYPDHIPGKPTFIPKNMTGAGGLIAARYLYAAAPKDGLTIGTIGRGLPFEGLLGGNEAFDFDPMQFVWLGSMNKESSVALAWHTAQVKTAQDLFKYELLTAANSADSDATIIPGAINGLIGTKFKLITGYSMPGAVLAVERGEAEGLGYWGWASLKAAKSDWIAEKKINILFQTALTPHPEIPEIPTAVSLAHNDEEREGLELLLSRDVLGRPFVAPPGTPPDRAKALRDGFMVTMQDPAFIAEANKQRLEVNPASGEEVVELLTRVLNYPGNVIEHVKKAMGR